MKSRKTGQTIPAKGESLLPLGTRPVDARWRRHYETLSSTRERLLRERTGQLAEAMRELEPHSMHAADSASDELEHDLELSELSARQDMLYEVEEALQRIVSGTYGVCEVTGQRIPAARLRAIPWTRFSRSAQERLENSGALPRARLGELRSAREPAKPPRRKDS